MGVRLYDPTLGRFIQTDPVAGGSANAHDYVYQDPINKFDLDGRFWGCSWLKKAHMAAVVGSTAWRYHSEIALVGGIAYPVCALG